MKTEGEREMYTVRYSAPVLRNSNVIAYEHKKPNKEYQNWYIWLDEMDYCLGYNSNFNIVLENSSFSIYISFCQEEIASLSFNIFLTAFEGGTLVEL